MCRLLDDQGQFYDQLLSEQEELMHHLPVHMARLQQLENQLKQQQPSALSTESKDERLNQIRRFIEEKLVGLIDEDSILKFFGQKTLPSNEKENQSTKTCVDVRDKADEIDVLF